VKQIIDNPLFFSNSLYGQPRFLFLITYIERLDERKPRVHMRAGAFSYFPNKNKMPHVAQLPIDRYRYPYTVFEGYRPDRPVSHVSQFIEDPMIIDSR
jgi:hypothetical protein